MNNNKLQFYGIHTVEHALATIPENIISIVTNKDNNNHKIKRIINSAKNIGINIEFWQKHKIDNLFKNENHQNIFITLNKNISQNISNLKKFLISNKDISSLLILDGIQDPRNLGSCIRSSVAFGVDAIIIPEKNSAKLTAVAVKSSSGAAFEIPIFYVPNLINILNLLKDNNFWIYGTDLAAKKSINQCKFNSKKALVLGHEESGIRELTKKNCDELFYIPMKNNNIQSLNITVAAGICLFNML